MKSVKVEDSVAEKVKDLKKYLRTHDKLPVTEAQILSQAFELAFERRDELVGRMKRVKKVNLDAWKIWLTPFEGGPVTDTAKDHDMVE